MLPVLAVTHYLATKPEGAVFACLIIAIVLFVIAALISFPARAWAYYTHAFFTLIAAGLVFFTLAFIV